MPLSGSRMLTWAALGFATIFVGMGVNAMARPRSGLAVWDFPLPNHAEAQKLIDNLMVVYGVRDVFMGAAMYATAWHGSRKALGWVLICAGAVAGVDGLVSIWQIDGGQWNHWGYGPVVALTGIALAGVFD